MGFLAVCQAAERDTTGLNLPRSSKERVRLASGWLMAGA